MKAVTCTDAKLEVVDLPDPVPTKGQVLLEVVRTGICGSDLHARYHADELADVTAEVGYDGMMRSTQSVVLGHEFSGRVLDHGPGTRKRVTRGHGPSWRCRCSGSGDQVHPTGLSVARAGRVRRAGARAGVADVPGAQRALRRARRADRADGGRPARRTPGPGRQGPGRGGHRLRARRPRGHRDAQGHRCAHTSSRATSPPAAARWPRRWAPTSSSTRRRTHRSRRPATTATSPGLAGVRPRGRRHEQAGHAAAVVARLPRWPRRPGWRRPKSPVVFECVGVPGMIDRIIADAPIASRVVVVGRLHGRRRDPTVRWAINKEIDLRFVLGLHPARLPRRPAPAGRRQGRPGSRWSPARSGCPASRRRSRRSATPRQHAKILVDPTSDVGVSRLKHSRSRPDLDLRSWRTCSARTTGSAGRAYDEMFDGRRGSPRVPLRPRRVPEDAGRGDPHAGRSRSRRRTSTRA